MKQNLTRKQLRNNILKDLKKVSSKERATKSQGFFKTGKGDYGEGDVFVGIRTPEIRKISKKYQKDLTLVDLDFFLQNKVHEYRLFALISPNNKGIGRVTIFIPQLFSFYREFSTGNKVKIFTKFFFHFETERNLVMI